MCTPDWDRPILPNQILGGHGLASLACSGSLVQGLTRELSLSGWREGVCLVEGVLTGRTEAGQAFPIFWHWPASGPLSGGGVPSTGRACQDCQVGICILQGRLVGRQN